MHWVADGIESATDIFSSIATWAGFRLSLKPADEDHPSGHGKIDALYFVELHVEVDPSVTIRDGHRIGHEVKSASISFNPRIQDIIVHLEPAKEPQQIVG